MLDSIYSIDIMISYRSYNFFEIFFYITVNQTACTSCINDEAEVLALYFNRNNRKSGLIQTINNRIVHRHYLK